MFKYIGSNISRAASMHSNYVALEAFYNIVCLQDSFHTLPLNMYKMS